MDGIEISCQAGTLIEQLWSPANNHHSESYGGSLQNRMRLGPEILAAAGEDYVVAIPIPDEEML